VRAVAERYGLDTTYLSHGRASGKLDGRELEIDPSSDYAVQLELRRNTGLYLEGALQGWPSESQWRFPAPDEAFADAFPIRYADRRLAAKLASDPGELAPFGPFLARWGKRLARVRVRGDDIEVHLSPGGSRRRERWMAPADLEALVEDVLTLGRALDEASKAADRD
jgi:hypothetical protein